MQPTPLKHSTAWTCNRRTFLRLSTGFAAGAPWAIACGADGPPGVDAPAPKPASAAHRNRSDAKVAIVPCRSYGPEVTAALGQCFDYLGGIGSLVKGKTVTVKLNLTGTNFTPFLDRPVGESYMTHSSTVMALGTLLFAAGAKRVRFVESTQSRAKLETTLSLADWDVNALSGLGTVEFENTRNLGKGKQYAHRPVPTGGYMFSSFDFNHAYDETDVLISLAVEEPRHRRRDAVDEEPFHHSQLVVRRRAGAKRRRMDAAPCTVRGALKNSTCPD